MQDDDDVAQLARFNQLIAQYPDLDMTLVADVLQHCEQDHAKALQILTDMAKDPEPIGPAHVNSDSEFPGVPKGLPVDDGSKEVAPPTSVRYGHSTNSVYPPEYSTIFQSSQSYSQHTPQNEDSECVTPVVRRPALKGAWASKSMGRKYRVDEICKRYKYMDRSVVEALFEKYGDCVDLVEQDVLEMFPVDQPEAFVGGGDIGAPEISSASSASGQGTKQSHMKQSQKQKAIAESLRQQAAEEIQRDSQRPEAIIASSSSMTRLRTQLWETREARVRLQHLAHATRKPEHVANAQRKEAELRNLSALFLTSLRNSEEYKNGYIDLHGLTKEESIQLIEWKLQDSGKRKFRVITGKGIHSHNEQAVLRPALEKHFRAKGISFSTYQDGVISVIP